MCSTLFHQYFASHQALTTSLAKFPSRLNPLSSPDRSLGNGFCVFKPLSADPSGLPFGSGFFSDSLAPLMNVWSGRADDNLYIRGDPLSKVHSANFETPSSTEREGGWLHSMQKIVVLYLKTNLVCVQLMEESATSEFMARKAANLWTS